MSTVVSSELEMFHQFVSLQLANGVTEKSVDEALAEFRLYQDELKKMRQEIAPALERSLKGESQPLDMEDVKRRGKQRMTDRGITG